MATQFRLPIVNNDDGTWGDILLQYLKKEHFDNGTDDPTNNGGHQHVTIRAGTIAAGTAPLKFASGPLMTTPEAGATEFLTDGLYFTITTGTVRKRIGLYTDASGTTGDIFYRDSTGNLTRVPIGSTSQVLKVVGGLPAWANAASIATSTKTTSYTVTTTDTAIFANATTASVVITLPAASGVSGYSFFIKRVDSSTNTVTVAANTSETIDGVNSFQIQAQYESYELVCDSVQRKPTLHHRGGRHPIPLRCDRHTSCFQLCDMQQAGRHGTRGCDGSLLYHIPWRDRRYVHATIRLDGHRQPWFIHRGPPDIQPSML
jgi:hypothetical protein